MLSACMITSIFLGVLCFILLIIRIEIGYITSDETLHSIAVGKRKRGKKQYC